VRRPIEDGIGEQWQQLLVQEIIVSTIGRKSVDSYLQGRKVTTMQDSGRPSVEVLHLIRKLRWMGMEEEAEEVQMKLRDTTPAGGVITTPRETD
jgi:hypothetical protein